MAKLEIGRFVVGLQVWVGIGYYLLNSHSMDPCARHTAWSQLCLQLLRATIGIGNAVRGGMTGRGTRLAGCVEVASVSRTFQRVCHGSICWIDCWTNQQQWLWNSER